MRANRWIVIGVVSSALMVVAGRGSMSAPDTQPLPLNARMLVYCTATAHAVRDAYVNELRSDGKCMTGALPAPITAKTCETATVYTGPAQDGRLVEVGIQPQFACLSCADDGERNACGQEASIQVKANLSASGEYLLTKVAGSVEVLLAADAKYKDDDTDVARISAGAGAGSDGGYNIVKGVISPVMEYKSGTTIDVKGSFGNAALNAAFALNATSNCNFKGEPESFVVAIGLPRISCPAEVPPEPMPPTRVPPPTGPR